MLYLEDLAAEAIAVGPEIRERFIREFITEAGSVAQHYWQELNGILSEIENAKDLILKTMMGVAVTELKNGSRGPLVRSTANILNFVADPIPNLYFTRDPFATIGDGISMNRMFSKTRNRETLYGRYIMNYHPDYRGQVPFYYQCTAPFCIEGGDILNLNGRVLVVGISQRTSPEAIELLAGTIFADPHSAIDTIIVLDIPSLRAYMHLDTVFTQVDYSKFTVHPGILDSVKIHTIRKSDGTHGFQVQQSKDGLAETLQSVLELDDVLLIPCGGQDRIAAAREQWNDGANTLCIAPGTVIVYDRNNITNKILADTGVTVLELPSSELSRGRGGPRCMSMPFVREDLEPRRK